MGPLNLKDVIEVTYLVKGGSGEARSVIGEYGGIIIGNDYIGRASLLIRWEADDDTSEQIGIDRVMDIKYLGEYPDYSGASG